jgi:tetratricopeptide (TPR) repeat protein
MRVIILSLILVLTTTVYAQVKILFPPRHWEITLDVNDFEPWDVLTERAIVGGRAADDFVISVLVDQVKPGTPASDVRQEYGSRALLFGQKETKRVYDLNDIAVLAFHHKADTPMTHTADLNEHDKKFAEDAVKDRWSYHGYIVKEDVAFDIHLSFDMTEARKVRAEQILKSFKIKETNELKDIAPVGRLFENNDPNTLNAGLVFAAKYPKDSDIYYILGEFCFRKKDYSKAQEYYLKALENHKSQPLLSTDVLWLCYDGLGLSYGIQKQYEKSFVYFKKGYKMAQGLDNPHIASSAFNLACMYAEANDVPNSLKFLKESISLEKTNKAQAQKDSSFEKLKGNPEFQKLVGN